MTRQIALVLVLVLSGAASASANPAEWAQEQLVRLIEAQDGRVNRKGGWLETSGVLFSVSAGGAVRSGEADLAVSLLYSPSRARAVLVETERDERARGGRFVKLPEGNGFAVLRNLDEGVRATVVSAKDATLYKVALTLPQAEGSKRLLKGYLAALERAVAMAELPDASSRRRVKGDKHLWEVTNSTGFGMTVTVQVIKKGEVTTVQWHLKRGQTLVLRVPPGNNFVTATSDREGVRPFVGWDRQDRGRFQASNFVIK